LIEPCHRTGFQSKLTNGKWKYFAADQDTMANIKKYSYKRLEGDETQLVRRGSSG